MELIQTTFNASAVTTTNLAYGAGAISKNTLSKYKEIYIRVKSSLDNVAHNANPSIMLLDNIDGFAPSNTKQITDYFGASVLLTKTDLPALQVGGLFSLQVAVQCANTPTSGSITVEVYGIPN